MAGKVVLSAQLGSMSREEFRQFGDFIETHYGIRMPDTKQTTLESRLRKRIRALGMDSYGEYRDFVFSDARAAADEIVQMMDVVTTNKTEFYREAAHTRFLVETALPKMFDEEGRKVDKPLAVWSAGCSTGEEPYTLSLLLSEYARVRRGFDYWILATDLSTHVLKIAERGVYPESALKPVDPQLVRRYFMRSRDRSKRHVRVVPELRGRIAFRRLNLMSADYGVRDPFDVIFCRNVLIYFERPVQERVLRRLTRHLRPGGYLFVGHSETLHGMDVGVESVGPMVYRKP